ncbi:hypothetical protein QJQ45_019507 [Haematococcus lacustris]|nr:hypothetical protein QJQ45_019507 [Haematococcus lacustris]
MAPKKVLRLPSFVYKSTTYKLGDCVLVNPDKRDAKPFAFHGEQELFVSQHKDRIHRNTVLGHCRVHTLSQYLALPCITTTDFFSRFTYKATEEVFEPDRVVVYCSCELPYNPDWPMIMCSGCQEWYHLHCLGLDTASLDTSKPFICAECQKAAPQDSPGPSPKRMRSGPDGTTQPHHPQPDTSTQLLPQPSCSSQAGTRGCQAGQQRSPPSPRGSGGTRLDREQGQATGQPRGGPGPGLQGSGGPQGGTPCMGAQRPSVGGGGTGGRVGGPSLGTVLPACPQDPGQQAGSAVARGRGGQGLQAQQQTLPRAPSPTPSMLSAPDSGLAADRELQPGACDPAHSEHVSASMISAEESWGAASCEDTF